MRVRSSKLALGVLFASVLTLPLGATSIGLGVFDLSGRLEVTQNSLLFGLQSSPATPNNEQALVVDGSGAFSGLSAGEIVTVKNMGQPAFPSGAISVPQWTVLSDGIDLDLMVAVIDLGIPVCTGRTDDAMPDGFTCRANATSPITLQKNGPGVTAALVLTGVAYTGSSSTGSTSFVGLFAAELSAISIDQLLGQFAVLGYVDTSYQATLSTVPEPGMLAGLGLGMLVVGSVFKKVYSKKA